MWQGIEVDDSDVSTLILARCRMEDAVFAVRSESPNNIYVVRDTFNRNMVGLDLSHGIFDFEQGRYLVNSTQFSCNDPLNDPYEGQTFLPEDISYAGLVSENIPNLLIGTLDAEINTFSGMFNGLVLHQSNAVIRNTGFHDIIRNAEVDGYLGFDNPFGNRGFRLSTGIGIHASLSSLEQFGLGANVEEEVTFEDVQTAIYTTQSSVDVNENRIEDSENGILATLPLYSGTNIQDNEILNPVVAGETGIEMTRGYSVGYHITDNTVGVRTGNIGLNPETAVQVNDFLNSGIPTSVADTNELDGGIGLQFWGQQGSGLSFFDNIISSLDGVTGMAITGFEGTRFGIADNELISSGTNRQGPPALRVISSPQLTICRNIINEGGVGAAFKFDCDPVEFGMNEFSDLYLALYYLGMNTMTGPQIHNGNTWDNNTISVGAEEAGGMVPENSKWVVNSQDDINYLPAVIIPSAGWFFNVDGDLETICRVEDLMDTVSIASWTQSDSLITIDSFSFSSANNRWNLRFKLFSKIDRYKDSIGLNPEIDSFYQKMKNTDIDSFNDVRKLYFEAFNGQSEDITLLASYRDSIDRYMQIQSSLEDSLFNYLKTSLDSTAIDSFQQATEAQYSDTLAGTIQKINFYDSLHETLSDDLYSYTTEKVQEALNLNITLSDDNIPKEYLKYAHEMLGQMLKNGAYLFGQDTLETLLDIAETCIDDGGPAVPLAATILPTCMRPDVDTCYPGVSLMQSLISEEDLINLTKDENRDLVLYPNPVRDILNIKINGSDSRIITIHIIDAGGKVVKKVVNLDSTQDYYNVDLGDLPSGLYHCTVKFERGLPLSEKFVIIE